MKELTSDQRRKFHGLTHNDEFSGCVEWTGAVDKDGYGVFYAHSRSYKAHRIAWYLANGDPGYLHVCHKCDNPSCVNPHHLFLGTHQDNIKDRSLKGRTRNNNLQGEASHLSRLSDIIADIIRHSQEKGIDLANQYGISQAQVSRIRSGTSRKIGKDMKNMEKVKRTDK